MKYLTKRELVESIENGHRILSDLISTIPRNQFLEACVWGDGWNIRDLLAHLTEWEQMFLTWFREGQAGRKPITPAPGYKWNETMALNRAIWQKHRGRSVDDVMKGFETSYEEIFSLVQKLTEDELLASGHFHWTGKNPLTTYLGANTASHYRTASKILKRWLTSRSQRDVTVKESTE